jgi:hypothetical protein
MEWPSGSLGLVGDFVPRIILRGGSKMHLFARWRRRPRFRCLAADNKESMPSHGTSILARGAKIGWKLSPKLGVGLDTHF